MIKYLTEDMNREGQKEVKEKHESRRRVAKLAICKRTKASRETCMKQKPTKNENMTSLRPL